VIYSHINLIDIYTLSSVSTEDALYVKEFLYDNRPSRPFRFTAKSSQSMVIDLSSAKAATLACLFNHNLSSGVTARIQGHASNAWGSPTFDEALTWRALDLYHRFNQSFRWWRFSIDDPSNSSFPEIGLAWLGEWHKFPNVHITPGRTDSPEFFQVEQVTQYGQDWDVYLSDTQAFELGLSNFIDPSMVDDLHAFLRNIGGSSGRFVFIPDESQPHVFLVKVVGNPSSQRVIYGASGELRNWSMKLKVLTRGITLL
jgi:hypothetical protein